MLDFLRDEPQNVVVVGDAFVASETLEEAVKAARLTPRNLPPGSSTWSGAAPRPSPGPAAWRS